jgi:hypothetical protein
MLRNIDTRHREKKEEEENYRKEKMRFAELEKNAFLEAKVMDRERDHALHMEEIFRQELATDEANRTHHIKADAHEKSSHKKHHEEAPLEEAVSAS